jgi:hypothetical protein
MERIIDRLKEKPDKPVNIVGNIIPPFNPEVDFAAEVERIFGEQGPIELDLNRGKREGSAGKEESSNNSFPSVPRLSEGSLKEEPDKPVSIVGNIISPFNPAVDLAAEMERIFGKPEPIELDLDRGKRKDSAGKEDGSNNSSPSVPRLSEGSFSTES